MADLSLIKDPETRKDPAWPAFVLEMDGQALSRSTLGTAWRWFRKGFASRTSEVETLKTIARTSDRGIL
jgi:hypothetical protein